MGENGREADSLSERLDAIVAQTRAWLGQRGSCLHQEIRPGLHLRARLPNAHTGTEGESQGRAQHRLGESR